MNEIESIDANTLKHGRLRLNYNEYIEHDVGGFPMAFHTKVYVYWVLLYRLLIYHYKATIHLNTLLIFRIYLLLTSWFEIWILINICTVLRPDIVFSKIRFFLLAQYFVLKIKIKMPSLFDARFLDFDHFIHNIIW